MSGISFSGLSSGIDFDGLRQALLSIERQAIKRLEDKQDKFELQRDAFKDVNSRLGSLVTKMSPILDATSTDLFKKVAATSSNTSVFTATALSTAAPGTYDMRVKNLALAESVISKASASVTSFTASVAGSDLNTDIDSATHLISSLHRRDNSANFVDADLGQLLIGDGGPAVAVDLSTLTAGSTFDDLVNKINADLTAGGSAVTASLNATGDGILLTSGTGNVSVDDGGDGKMSATKFGLSTGGLLVAAPKDGGDLDADLQSNTALSKLNSGAGVADLVSGLKLRSGTSSATVNLSAATTVNDVLTALNGAGLPVSATIDGAKNGFSILSTDADKSLGIEENGGSTAVNLGIFGKSHVLQMKTSADAGYFDVYLDGITLDSIKNGMNAVTGRTFSASVVDNRLLVSSNATGTANALNLKDNAAAGGIFEQLEMLITNAADDTTISNAYSTDSTKGGYLQTAKDAVFSVNGLTVTRSKNSGLDDVISGVTLNLVGPSSSTGANFPTDYASSTLTISKDTATTAKTIEDFVNQYNSMIDFLDKSTKINPEADDGVLAGNSTARSLKDSLFQRLSQLNPDVGQKYRSIFEIKDESGAYAFKMDSAKSGQITLNKTALQNVLATNPDDVAHVLRFDSNADNSFDDGIIFDMNALAKEYNTATTGLIDGQITSYASQITDLDKQILRMEERLAKQDEILKRRFATAEQLISSMQSQSNYLSTQLTNLNRR